MPFLPGDAGDQHFPSAAESPYARTHSNSKWPSCSSPGGVASDHYWPHSAYRLAVGSAGNGEGLVGQEEDKSKREWNIKKWGGNRLVH